MKRSGWIIGLMVLMLATVPAFATNYYLSPTGTTMSDSPGTLTAPWGQLAVAKEYFQTYDTSPDTLFILGGTYSTAQKFHVERLWQCSGSKGDAFVVKAYGDEVAKFQTSGSEEPIFSFANGNDYITIDGWSHQSSTDSCYIRFDISEDAPQSVLFMGNIDGTDDCEYITVKGCHFDGAHEDSTLQEAVRVAYCKDFVFESNLVENIYHPTGQYAHGGDASDTTQATGTGLVVMSSEQFIIRNNTWNYANDSAIEVGRYLNDPAYRISKYFQVINNEITAGWGSGICVTDDSEYGLIDKNFVINPGATTTDSKPAIYIGGNHMTVRRNVVYAPSGHVLYISGKSSSVGSGGWSSTENLIYSNTFYKGAGTGLWMMISNPIGNEYYSVENNLFANNIWYASTGADSLVPDNRETVLAFSALNASNDHNWASPDTNSVRPHTTNFGNNYFLNNVISRTGSGTAVDSAICFILDDDYNGSTTSSFYSIDMAESLSVVFNNTLATDPYLISTRPDTFGYTAAWYALPDSSGCVDGGVTVDDMLGFYTELIAPGYGWGKLVYMGAAPDVGAYEYSDTTAAVAPGAYPSITPKEKPFIRPRR